MAQNRESGHCWSKKVPLILPVLLPNAELCSNSFTIRLSSEVVMRSWLTISPQLKVWNMRHLSDPQLMVCFFCEPSCSQYNTAACMYLGWNVALNESLNKGAIENVFSELRKWFTTNAWQLGVFLCHQPAIAQQQWQPSISNNEKHVHSNDL